MLDGKEEAGSGAFGCRSSPSKWTCVVRRNRSSLEYGLEPVGGLGGCAPLASVVVPVVLALPSLSCVLLCGASPSRLWSR